MAGRGQGGVSSPVVAEGSVRPVGAVAVGFHDEVVLRPVEVDLDAPVVEGFEGGVDEGPWQVRLLDEVEEAPFELAAREGRLAGGRAGEPRLAVMPVRALDRRLDRGVVEDAKPLGLCDRAVEVARLHRRREVEQRAGDGRDRDAVVAGGVLGVEGAWAVQADPPAAVPAPWCAHIHPGRVRRQQAPPCGRGSVAQDGAGPAREHRREIAPLPPDTLVSHGVHGCVKAVQSAFPHAPCHRAPPEAERPQLLERHDAPLRPSQRR